MTICRYHIKEMIIFLRKIQRCSVSTPASTLNNTGVMLNSVDTSDNTGYSTDGHYTIHLLRKNITRTKYFYRRRYFYNKNYGVFTEGEPRTVTNCCQVDFYP